MPGVPAGTRNMDMVWPRGASGAVTTITMRNAAVAALDEKNLWPLITHSSPSRTARALNCVGSAPPSGSVIEKQENTSPSSSGFRYFSCCAGVPNFAMISALPVSGAWQPKITGAQLDRPRISFSRQSLTAPCPCPPSDGSRCVAHSP
jgi:hypothetical protein